MKWLFLFLFSLFQNYTFASSCCVSNTSVSNLMLLPASWQQTFTLSQNRVIGDVNSKGRSTFRGEDNKEITSLARIDLAYSWNFRYQTGISVKYQNKSREFAGAESSDSGWNDLGLSHAYRLFEFERIWIFQTLNIPTARSVYNSRANMAVDAHGTGAYVTSLGVFGVENVEVWDFIYSAEFHHSFSRSFETQDQETDIGSFSGGSLTFGAGYIPWKSKARYGVALTPRFEGRKETTTNGERSMGDESLVWDTSLNWTYTINAENAVGLNYTDQTIFGPVKNSLLNRSLSFQFQKRWL